MGALYASQKEYETALNYYNRSLKIRDSIGDEKGMSSVYNNLGILLKEKGDVKRALVYFKSALAIDLKLNNKEGIVIDYINIGSNHSNKDSALLYHKKSLEVAKELGLVEREINSLVYIAQVHLDMGNLIDSKEMSQSAFKKATNLGYPNSIEITAEQLHRIYEEEGDLMNSMKMLKLYYEMRDSVDNEENKGEAIKQQTQYEYNKQKALDKATYESQLAIEKEETKLQQVITIAAMSVLALGTLFLMFVYRRLQITKKQKSEIETKKN